MTTHETHREAEVTPEFDNRVETAEPMPEQGVEQAQPNEPAELDTPAEPARMPAETEAPTGNLDSREEPVDSTGSHGSADEMLFGGGDLSGLRSRWTEVQSAFVDDPRDCVQKADGLVADVVDRLTTGFSQARSYLEEQWDRGEEVSTEDLRIALKRYREFFERLLAV